MWLDAWASSNSDILILLPFPQREKQMPILTVRLYIPSSLPFYDISEPLQTSSRCGARRNLDIMVALHPHHAAYYSAILQLHPADETDTSSPRDCHVNICWYGNNQSLFLGNNA